VGSICTSDVKAKESDSPLAWGAGVVGGSVPTAGAAAFLIGYGAVAGFNVGHKKPPHIHSSLGYLKREP
jgi:hypothetical protein